MNEVNIVNDENQGDDGTWVEWKTLKASPAKKSLEERRPATGRRVNPVVADKKKIIEIF